MLVFSGFNSPKFLHRAFLPNHEHFDIDDESSYRLITTGDIPRTALLVKCKNYIFIIDLQNVAQPLCFETNANFRSNFDCNSKCPLGLEGHSHATPPYFFWPPVKPPDIPDLEDGGISPWHAMKICFNGQKLLTTEMEIPPPNNMDTEFSQNYHGCFKARAGHLVKLTDTRALWEVVFNCDGEEYRSLVEQDFLMDIAVCSENNWNTGHFEILPTWKQENPEVYWSRSRKRESERSSYTPITVVKKVHKTEQAAEISDGGEYTQSRLEMLPNLLLRRIFDCLNTDELFIAQQVIFVIFGGREFLQIFSGLFEISKYDYVNTRQGGSCKIWE